MTDSTIDLVIKITATSVTTIGIIVALFRERIAGHYWRPKIQIRAATTPPLAHLVTTTTASKVYYYRLQVTNDGRGAANNVEISLTSVQRKTKDGLAETLATIPKGTLVWALSQPRSGLLSILYPGSVKYCDLCHFPKGATNVNLDVLELSHTPLHKLSPGTYILELVANASNHAPLKKRIEIQFNGNWHQEEDVMLGTNGGVIITDIT